MTPGLCSFTLSLTLLAAPLQPGRPDVDVTTPTSAPSDTPEHTLVMVAATAAALSATAVTAFVIVALPVGGWFVHRATTVTVGSTAGRLAIRGGRTGASLAAAQAPRGAALTLVLGEKVGNALAGQVGPWAIWALARALANSSNQRFQSMGLVPVFAGLAALPALLAAEKVPSVIHDLRTLQVSTWRAAAGAFRE